MARAFVFPGQGSQSIGMGAALAAAFPEARAVFDEVDDALDTALFRLMQDGPMETLTLTENAQPAIMAVSLAVVRTLEQAGHPLAALASHVAGHSLGEYSALAATGALGLADTARLLRRRGQAMQAAVPAGKGAMAAILGLDIDSVSKAAAEASENGEVCVAANDNAPGQIVISGHAAAVARASEAAKALGAKRAMPLPVSAPFHSPLMAPAAEVMRSALEETRLSTPALPVITNVTAAPEQDPSRLTALLVEQVTAPVRWRESVLAMPALGIEATVECGNGNVLTAMIKRIDRQITMHTLGTPDDIETFVKTL